MFGMWEMDIWGILMVYRNFATGPTTSGIHYPIVLFEKAASNHSLGFTW